MGFLYIRSIKLASLVWIAPQSAPSLLDQTSSSKGIHTSSRETYNKSVWSRWSFPSLPHCHSRAYPSFDHSRAYLSFDHPRADPSFDHFRAYSFFDYPRAYPSFVCRYSCSVYLLYRQSSSCIHSAMASFVAQVSAIVYLAFLALGKEPGLASLEDDSATLLSSLLEDPSHGSCHQTQWGGGGGTGRLWWRRPSATHATLSDTGTFPLAADFLVIRMVHSHMRIYLYTPHKCSEWNTNVWRGVKAQKRRRTERTQNTVGTHWERTNNKTGNIQYKARLSS